MNSVERREGRYQRRKAKREAKKQAAQMSFEEVMSFENLCKAGLKCCNNTRWKTSTINFETYLLKYAAENYNELVNDSYQFRGFTSFYTYEHGKIRDIDAMKIQDRQVQKCLCNNLLNPVYTRSFVYDNGACLDGKGMDFQLNRLKKFLHDHYRKYGLEGGIYQFDFSSYFKSLEHNEIKARNAMKVTDPKLQKLFNDRVDDFDQMGVLMEPGRGVGLGGEVSQLIALEYANPLDHYIKDVLRKHGYGRYNDDGYIISNSLDELRNIQQEITEYANKLGIVINPKKNKITPFKNHSFTFLKIHFTLTDTGKVIMKINKKTSSIMRHKLKIFKNWYDEGKMQFEDICQSYQSYRAHMRRCNSYNTLKNMDTYFVQLFTKALANRDKIFKCTLNCYNNNGKWVYIIPSCEDREK